MIRLIRAGLAYANLFEVASPAMVDRYNRALRHLTGRVTDLESFHIDISGFSPEVGDALGDMSYLNPNGCNRQFILLSTDQMTAPLLNMQFSTSRGILRQFIEANFEQLFALTASDAVAGELVNSVYSLDTPERLLDIRTVTVQADTTEGTVAKAAALSRKLDQFRTAPDAWYDDVLIAQMIDLARSTGNVKRAPVHLSAPSFSQDSFWTAHFGGLFVLRTGSQVTVVAETALPAGMEGFSLDDPEPLARWLWDQGLVEPILDQPGPDSAELIHEKMAFLIIATAAAKGIGPLSNAERNLRGLARRLAGELPAEYDTLSRLARWAASDGPWPKVTSDDPAFFYTVRAAAGPHRDMVNMLIAALCPADIRQLFICHKPAFYARYASWSEEMQNWVADYLSASYVPDKHATRARLFTPKPRMRATSVPKTHAVRGPWG